MSKLAFIFALLLGGFFLNHNDIQATESLSKDIIKNDYYEFPTKLSTLKEVEMYFSDTMNGLKLKPQEKSKEIFESELSQSALGQIENHPSSLAHGNHKPKIKSEERPFSKTRLIKRKRRPYQLQVCSKENVYFEIDSYGYHKILKHLHEDLIKDVNDVTGVNKDANFVIGILNFVVEKNDGEIYAYALPIKNLSADRKEKNSGESLENSLSEDISPDPLSSLEASNFLFFPSSQNYEKKFDNCCYGRAESFKTEKEQIIHHQTVYDEALSPKNVQYLNEVESKEKAFPHIRFSHSEQFVLYYLKNNMETYLSKLISNLGNSFLKLHDLQIHLFSTREVCKNCQEALSGKRILNEIVQKHISDNNLSKRFDITYFVSAEKSFGWTKEMNQNQKKEGHATTPIKKGLGQMVRKSKMVKEDNKSTKKNNSRREFVFESPVKKEGTLNGATIIAIDQASPLEDHKKRSGNIFQLSPEAKRKRNKGETNKEEEKQKNESTLPNSKTVKKALFK